jgi:hypothetical protein
LLYQPPPLFLRLRCEGGRVYSYRLIPALAGSGFLLSPLARDDEDFVALLRGGELPRVVALAVEGEGAARGCYAGARVVVR